MRKTNQYYIKEGEDFKKNIINEQCTMHVCLKLIYHGKDYSSNEIMKHSRNVVKHIMDCKTRGHFPELHSCLVKRKGNSRLHKQGSKSHDSGILTDWVFSKQNNKSYTDTDHQIV